jgi:hypothetical protein
MRTNAMESAAAVLRQPPSGMVVITASYGPDIELFADLHASVLRHFPNDVNHYVVVPAGDLADFSRFAGPRCRVLSVSEFLPREVVDVPGLNLWLNIRSPWPPLRGWIVQQLVKIGLASDVDADAVVVADSDVVFIRPVSLNDFTRGSAVLLCRAVGVITEDLPRHMIWVQRAHQLLGLPLGSPPYNDYVGNPVPWDRRLVSAMCDRVEEVTGRPWTTAVGRNLHVSECMLYGTFVDAASGGAHPAQAEQPLRCHSYWDEVPLDLPGAVDFLAGASDEDFAVMLSAKSATPLHVRRAALRELGIA